MKLPILLALIALSSAAPLLAQEGQATFPSISARLGTFIQNRTGTQIWFSLESAGTDVTAHQLAPNEGATFQGAPSDQYFNVYIRTGDEVRSAGIDIPGRYYIDFDAAGILDIYQLPPR